MQSFESTEIGKKVMAITEFVTTSSGFDVESPLKCDFLRGWPLGVWQVRVVIVVGTYYITLF